MALRLLARCAAGAVLPRCSSITTGARSRTSMVMRGIATGSRPTQFAAGSNDFPWDQTEDPAALEDGTEGLDPAGTPWTPAPVAEDYEETITILLDSNKVEDALDIFARMVKRGFRPSTEIVDSLYETAKTKPEWQAAAVKTINGIDFSSLK